MIAGLNPYPGMKQSGVPWLGAVPEHWLIMPPKRALQARSAGTAPVKNTASNGPRLGWVPAFSASGQDVWLERPMFRGPGLVLSAVGARCGKTFRANGAWAVVANTHVLLPREAQHRDFWWYVTNDERWWERAGAAQPFVQVSKTLDRAWAIPPLPEQAAIVRFLDYVDRRIRRYIRAKQKLIKLLEERVAARASQVMRHPRCTRQRLGRVATEHVRSIEREDAETYVALGLYNRGRGIFHKRPTLGAELGDSTFSWVEPDDLVISGQFAWEGAVALASSAEKKTIVSHRYYVLRGVTDRATTPYLWALLRSDFGAMLLDQHSRGAAGRNRPLNLRTLLKEPVPVPPFEAQLSVDELLAANGPLHAQATRQINLLREFRTRLISAVVTGKLDVREAAARLPREPEDLELLDESEVGSEAQEAGAGDADDEVEEVAA